VIFSLVHTGKIKIKSEMVLLPAASGKPGCCPLQLIFEIKDMSIRHPGKDKKHPWVYANLCRKTKHFIVTLVSLVNGVSLYPLGIYIELHIYHTKCYQL
jgi:hypothetical protein